MDKSIRLKTHDLRNLIPWVDQNCSPRNTVVITNLRPYRGMSQYAYVQTLDLRNLIPWVAKVPTTECNQKHKCNAHTALSRL